MLISSVLSIFFGLLPNTKAAEMLNAGFTQTLWYSSNDFFTNETIRVYSALQNQSGFDLTGKIQLYDNDRLMEEAPFALANGTITYQWSDLKLSQGTHKLYKKIIEVKKSVINLPSELVEVKYPTSTSDEKVVIPKKQNITPTTTAQAASSSNLFIGPLPTISIETAQTPSSSAITPDAPSYSDKSGSSPFLDKTKEIIGNMTNGLVKKLEDKKNQLAADTTNTQPLPILEKPINELEKKTPFLKIPRDKLPTLAQVYTTLLSAAIWMLNTWWVVLLFYLLIIVTLWRIWRRMRRDY